MEGLGIFIKEKLSANTKIFVKFLIPCKKIYVKYSIPYKSAAFTKVEKKGFTA